MAATRKLGRPQVPSRFQDGPRTPGRAGTGMGRNSVAVELNHPAAATVILGNAPALGSGVLDPHTSQETRIQAEGQAQRAAPSSPAFRGGPTPPGSRRPAPTRTQAGVGVRLSRLHLLCHWCSRFRGRRRPPLPRGVAAPLLPRGRGTLPGASAPTSPAPARPRRPPAPQHPDCAQGLAGGPPLTPRPRTPRPAQPRPLTRPHHGGAATAPGHPQKRHQRASARGRLQRARRRGTGSGRAGPARGARPEPRGRRRGGARPPVARCASPRRGPGGKKGRGGRAKEA